MAGRRPLPAAAYRSMKLSDENGNRWHMLTGISSGEKLIEVMAATCFDGIGVIVRWTKRVDQWFVESMDTEGCEWESVDFSDESNEIPPEPPQVWDDLSQNAQALAQPERPTP